MVKKYLQLTRAHTTPLEAVPALVGALLATGGAATVGVLYWLVFGVMYHLAGYGMNSLRDWQKGFDRDDPNKQHHPLNDGRISEPRAEKIVYTLFAITGIMAFSGAVGDTLAVIAVILMIGAGVAYNEIGKITEHKYIPICIAHSMVFLVPYTSMGGRDTFLATLGVAIIFLWVMFQIAVSGEIKDMDTEEANLVNDMKLPKLIMMALMIRVELTVIAAVAVYIYSTISALAIVITVGMISIAVSIRMVIKAKVGERKRGNLIRDMASIEIYSLGILVVAFNGILGDLTTFLILGGSVAWVVLLNRYMWGTWVAPDV